MEKYLITIQLGLYAASVIYAMLQRSRRIEAEDENAKLRAELADLRKAAETPTVGPLGLGGGGRR